MILGYVTTLQIEELERTGKATITEAPAAEGVVSFPLVFEAELRAVGFESSRARAHLPRIDLHALGLSLMTDEQSFASYERWLMSRNAVRVVDLGKGLDHVAAIYARTPI